jgi:hypothetical protein
MHTAFGSNFLTSLRGLRSFSIPTVCRHVILCLLFIYLLISLFIYLFIIYLTSLSVAQTIYRQMKG